MTPYEKCDINVREKKASSFSTISLAFLDRFL